MVLAMTLVIPEPTFDVPVSDAERVMVEMWAALERFELPRVDGRMEWTVGMMHGSMRIEAGLTSYALHLLAVDRFLDRALDERYRRWSLPHPYQVRWSYWLRHAPVQLRSAAERKEKCGQPTQKGTPCRLKGGLVCVPCSTHRTPEDMALVDAFEAFKLEQAAKWVERVGVAALADKNFGVFVG